MIVESICFLTDSDIRVSRSYNIKPVRKVLYLSGAKPESSRESVIVLFEESKLNCFSPTLSSL